MRINSGGSVVVDVVATCRDGDSDMGVDANILEGIGIEDSKEARDGHILEVFAALS